MTDTAVRAPGSAFVEHSVNAAGFTVRYLEAGDGPALLCLPGAGGPVMTFALDTLAERFRVILLELPGWGAQPNDVEDFDGLSDQVAEIATALGLERFHLMGTSLGGACALALRRPPHRQGRIVGARSTGQVPRASVHPATFAPESFVKAFRSHPDRLPHMSPPDPEFMGRVWPTVERLMGDGLDLGLTARLAEFRHAPSSCSVATTGSSIRSTAECFVGTCATPRCSTCTTPLTTSNRDRPEAFADVVGDFLQRGMQFLINDHDGLINP